MNFPRLPPLPDSYLVSISLSPTERSSPISLADPLSFCDADLEERGEAEVEE